MGVDYFFDNMREDIRKLQKEGKPVPCAYCGEPMPPEKIGMILPLHCGCTKKSRKLKKELRELQEEQKKADYEWPAAD